MRRLKNAFRSKEENSSLSSTDDGETFLYIEPEFRHSLYEDTSYGPQPDWGTTPLRGNGVSVTGSPWVQDGGPVVDLTDPDLTPKPRRSSVAQQNDAQLDEMEEMLKRMSQTNVGEQQKPSNKPSTGDLKEFRARRSGIYDQPRETTDTEAEDVPTSSEAVDEGYSSADTVIHTGVAPGKRIYDQHWETTDTEDVPTSSEVVDKSWYNSTDTVIHTAVAPAVTQETVRERVHEIREEQITRDIHTHDVFHRILPIVDVEVLPTRHFKKEGGRLIEFKPEDVPGRSNHWVVAETLSKGKKNFTPVPRKFTARRFDGTDGDAKKYITDEGYERTEQTWVHPPRLETGARNTGQTVPIYL